jgi:flagellin-specific chaperone FliS
MGMEKQIDRLEISTAEHREVFDSVAWSTPQRQIMDMFRKKSVRFEAIRQFYEPLCVKSISENINKAENIARELVGAAWKDTGESVNAAYRGIIEKLNGVYREKQGLLKREEERSRREIAFLRNKIKELREWSVPEH